MNYLQTGSQFLKEVVTEFKKVTWPTRKDVIASTVVVVILVCIVAIYVSSIDFILTGILGFLLR